MRQKILKDRKNAEGLVAKLERRDVYFFEFNDDGRKVDTTDAFVVRLKQRIEVMDYMLQQD
jgi:hypothetical protein